MATGHADEQVVPCVGAVVLDDAGRLLGVVPRAAVLDALSAVPVRAGAR